MSTANAVDGDAVPVPHFGLALDTAAFHALADRVRQAGIHFEIEPHLRFQGMSCPDIIFWRRHFALSNALFKKLDKDASWLAGFCAESPMLFPTNETQSVVLHGGLHWQC